MFATGIDRISSRQIQKLKKQNAQLQDNLDQKKGMRLKRLNSKLRCQQQKHQSTCNDLRKQVRNLELVNDNLTAELYDVRADDNIISMKIDGKMYGPAVRKTAYHCLSNQVPVETTCHVIRSVVKDISAMTIDCLPNPTTENQFADELGS